MANEKGYGVRQRTHDGVDLVMDKAEYMRNGSKEAMHRLNERAIIMNENVDRYIRKNKKKSVLIAASIGVALGAVIAALMMRKKT